MVAAVAYDLMEVFYSYKEETVEIENRPEDEKYEEYSRFERNVAFVEELGRKYAGEVY